MLANFFSGASVIGFSGSRVLPSGAPVGSAVSAAVSAGCDRFVVGCQRGVDAAARDSLANFDVSVSVFAASDYGVGRSSFARRSVAAVSAVVSGGGVWVCFAGSGCPAGLVPSSSSSACFCGSGSGSWASLAFAVGSGCRCLLWLPAGLVPPASWGFSSFGGGWFWWEPSAIQLSLF